MRLYRDIFIDEAKLKSRIFPKMHRNYSSLFQIQIQIPCIYIYISDDLDLKLRNSQVKVACY